MENQKRDKVRECYLSVISTIYQRGRSDDRKRALDLATKRSLVSLKQNFKSKGEKISYLKKKVYFLFIRSKKQLVKLNTNCSTFQYITDCITGTDFKTDFIQSFISVEYKSKSTNIFQIQKYMLTKFIRMSHLYL